MLILGYIFEASGDFEFGEDFFKYCNRSLFAEIIKMKKII
jgi:hypothetical protein